MTVSLLGQDDPNDPPIDDADHAGNQQGLTDRWLYDENLSDGAGLDASGGVAVERLDGSGTFCVSVAALLDELE